MISLEAIQIASPCSVPWAGMDGDDRVRFCGTCSKQVFNLSAMTRAEAEALITDRHGDLCAQLYKRADGTVMTADCPEGASAIKRWRLGFYGGVAGMFLSILGIWRMKEMFYPTQQKFTTVGGFIDVNWTATTCETEVAPAPRPVVPSE